MNHIMAVCDAESDYASKLVDYLNMKEGFLFDVRYFSSVDAFHRFESLQIAEVVLVSEEFYEYLIKEKREGEIIVLCKWKGEWSGKGNAVAKYQSCEAIVKEVMQILSGKEEKNSHIFRKTPLKIIGFYSPVKRSLQTSFAFTMGQMLSKKGKTLYLNMEGFSGLGYMLKKNFTKDLSDVFYYLQNKQNGIAYLIAGITEDVGGLDILPPMKHQIDLIGITQREWIYLFQEFERSTDYEYLLLDLSDSIQGLFEILRQCTRIYTMTAGDGFAMAKVDQYEKILLECQYDDVLKKTLKFHFPQFTHLSEQLEYMSMSELAFKTREIIQEDFGENR